MNHIATLFLILTAAGVSSSSTPNPCAGCLKAAEDLIREDELPGLSVAAWDNGTIAWSAAFGLADRKSEAPVTETTMFRTGSVSKALTSAALGALLESGELDLDEPVERYLQAFPHRSRGITSRLAAAHLSGIPHYSGSEFVNQQSYESAVHALEKFKDKPLVSDPGEQFLYSSYGWNLLGAVVEAATGSHFLEVMQKTVFDPLGLENTAPELASEPSPRMAQPYARVGNMTMKAPALDNSDAFPSAGFLSTPLDLVTFGAAMLEGELLQPTTVQTLWANQRTTAGDPTNYGLGWQLSEKGGHQVIGMGGSHVGATAGLWILVEEKLVIAAATNTNSREFSAFMDQLIVELLARRALEAVPD